MAISACERRQLSVDASAEQPIYDTFTELLDIFGNKAFIRHHVEGF